MRPKHNLMLYLKASQRHLSCFRAVWHWAASNCFLPRLQNLPASKKAKENF
jgi:hypothetical protein